jgi:hypothetical protein
MEEYNLRRELHKVYKKMNSNYCMKRGVVGYYSSISCIELYNSSFLIDSALVFLSQAKGLKIGEGVSF